MENSLTKFYLNNKILFKHIMSYMLIMVLLLMSGVIIYFKTMEVLRQELKETSLSMLEKGKDSLEQYLTGIDNFANQIFTKKKIKYFSVIDDLLVDDNSYYIYDTLQDIFLYNDINNLVDSYFIFFRKSKSIIYPSTFYKYDSFYESIFKYDDMSNSEFLNGVLNQSYYKKILPAKSVIFGQNKERMVLYLKSYSLDSLYDENSDKNVKDGIVVAVLIKESQIHKLFNNVNMQESDQVYIVDENDNIITSSSDSATDRMKIPIEPNVNKGNFTQKINSTKMNISFTKSSYNNWTYVAAISNKIVFFKADYIKKITGKFVLIVSLLGIVIIFLLSYYRSKPVNELLKTIKNLPGFEADKSHNEYFQIRSVFAQLYSNNNNMKKSLENQVPFLQSTFFERLLNGKIVDMESINNIMANINISFNGNIFFIAIAQIVGYQYLEDSDAVKEYNLAKIVIKEYLNDYFKNNVNFYDMDEDKLVLIISLNSELNDNKSYHEMFEAIHEYFSGIFHISIRFYLGNCHNSLINIWRSLYEAKEMMEKDIYQNNEYVLEYDIESIKNLKMNIYYYPIDIEERIINNVKTGNRNEVFSLLAEIQVENFSRRKLSTLLRKQLLLEIYSTILKILEELGISSIPEFESLLSLVDKQEHRIETQDLFKKIELIFESIIDSVNKKKTDYKSKQINDILEFINKESTNINMSITFAAMKFKMSEIYFSQFFKSQTNENFSNYLENVRLEQACRLISDTNFSIYEIAERVGYSNDQVFRRAFKRVKGINPTEFKNNIKTYPKNS